MSGKKSPFLPVNQRRRSFNLIAYHERKRLFSKDPHCSYCGAELTFSTSTIDHVKPLSKGGFNHVSNFVLSCYPCNHSKGDKFYLMDYFKPETT